MGATSRGVTLQDKEGMMTEQQYNEEWARGILDDGLEQAQGLINDPGQIEDLLEQLQEKVTGLPETIGNAFTNVPLMANMVKSYITGEYTQVSPKVVISLLSAFVYLVKKQDLIPDDIPVVGFADDVAVATAVMALNEPELNAYAEWRQLREGGQGDAINIEPIEATVVESSRDSQPE